MSFLARMYAITNLDFLNVMMMIFAFSWLRCSRSEFVCERSKTCYSGKGLTCIDDPPDWGKESPRKSMQILGRMRPEGRKHLQARMPACVNHFNEQNGSCIAPSDID
ncbi:hypothetical protein DFH08DRAFT_876866 [Mycena albidolilacea]|uniref:Uncharacterized protein n=1 Tax=Mycena albidolilacea TaxID=1033008 RepID=A0AAD7EN04_9AGAR|nr:hypothetical protein DFH08DRAFT_876866 [Mycena albidolilacea]